MSLDQQRVRDEIRQLGSRGAGAIKGGQQLGVLLPREAKLGAGWQEKQPSGKPRRGVRAARVVGRLLHGGR